MAFYVGRVQDHGPRLAVHALDGCRCGGLGRRRVLGVGVQRPLVRGHGARLISGMTLTPEAGTYLVFFDAEFTNTSNNTNVTFWRGGTGRVGADVGRVQDHGPRLAVHALDGCRCGGLGRRTFYCLEYDQ